MLQKTYQITTIHQRCFRSEKPVEGTHDSMQVVHHQSHCFKESNNTCMFNTHTHTYFTVSVQFGAIDFAAMLSLQVDPSMSNDVNVCKV